MRDRQTNQEREREREGGRHLPYAHRRRFLSSSRQGLVVCIGDACAGAALLSRKQRHSVRHTDRGQRQRDTVSEAGSVSSCSAHLIIRKLVHAWVSEGPAPGLGLFPPQADSDSLCRRVSGGRGKCCHRGLKQNACVQSLTGQQRS